MESAALDEHWRSLHAESLATLRRIAAQPPAGALDPAFVDVLPAEALRGLREAEAHASEERGTLVALLREQVCAHEALLEEMYEDARRARADVAALSPEAAANRGEHGLGQSPADRCSALATALRGHEAELQLKQTSARAMHLGMPAAELQASIVAWELQPMLEPVDAMRAGLEEQEALETCC